MLHQFFSLLKRILPVKEVFAHCDIPCGIYTAEPAQTAARTVAKMTEKLYEQVPPADNAERQEWLEFENTLARCILVKEQHAQICKEQLLLLWTDYFKEEHLKAFPTLHETFWRAAKLCSKAKQEVSLDTAKKLQKAVDEIAEIFGKAEATKKQ